MGLSSFNRARNLKAKLAEKETVVEVIEERTDYNAMTVPQLKEIAADLEIEGYANMLKAELVEVLGGE